MLTVSALSCFVSKKFLGIFVRTPYGQPGPLRLNHVDSARTFSHVGWNYRNFDSGPSVRIPPMESGVLDEVLLKLRDLHITDVSQYPGLAAREEDLGDFFKLLN